ncbi:MAG: hypothetical protein GEU79_05980 [Acidimicrobiia bacterium]|nr:hypothetical protein [Acidimicrobiia bacterium]
MTETIRTDDDLRELLGEVNGTVFQAAPEGSSWDACARELTTAYQLSKQAVERGDPVVYVVHNDDLLGRRGAVGAMVATGLLSAARTLALETAKAGVSINVLAVDDTSSNDQIAVWVQRLLESHCPTGEVVHLGATHLGKALP